MADIPTFGNVDQSVGSATSGNAADDKAYAWANSQARSKGLPEPFTLVNGKWQDNSAPGANKSTSRDTFGEWVDGMASGNKDVMGHNTVQGQAAADKAAAGQQQDGIAARMQKFIDEMLGPMNTNDPVYRGLMQAGTDAAQKHAGSVGLAGRSGLAGTQAASVAMNNVQPWLAGRVQAGQQMLGQLSGRDISLGNLAQGQQQINNSMAESQSNAAKNTWGTIGSIGGGLVGGAPGAAIGGALTGSLAGGGAGGPSYSGSGFRPGGGYKPGGNGTGY